MRDLTAVARRSTTAFVLEARPTRETEHVKETLLSRIAGALGAVAEAGADLNDDGGFDDDRDDARRENDAIEGIFSAMRDAALPRSSSAKQAEHAEQLARLESSRALRRSMSLTAAAEIKDCPLTCCVTAIVETVPRRLVALQAADAGINASRIWTTLCCISFLERINVSWIWGDGDLYPHEERTIVDAAREWVERCAEERPALAELLATGALQKRAGAATLLWRRACDQRVSELRRSKAIRAHMNKSHAHRCVTLHRCYAADAPWFDLRPACRAVTAIVRAITTRHETASVFLSEPLEGLQRWQSASAAKAHVATTPLRPALCGCRIHGSRISGRVPAAGEHLDVRSRRIGFAPATRLTLRASAGILRKVRTAAAS